MSAFTTFLEADWAERMGLTLVHSLWQIALVAVVYAIVASRLRNRSADSRYALGCVAMLAMLVLPIGTYALLSDDPMPAATGPSVEMQLPSDSAPTDPSTANALPPIASLGPTENVPGPTALAPAKSDATELLSALHLWLPWVTTVWLMGVLLLSVRPFLGWLHVRRLQCRGLSPLSEALQHAGERLTRRIGVKRVVRLAESALVEVPTVVGYLRPIVLLPASAIAGLSAAEIELILVHELAHVRRHDCLVNLAQTVIEALLFYHPGMWWVSSQIRKERENCCDDVAVAIGGNRRAYVNALARLEQQRVPTPAVGLAATGGVLLTRVRRLLGRPTTEFGYRCATAWLAGLATIGFVAAALAMTPTSQENVENSTKETAEKDAPSSEEVRHEQVKPLVIDLIDAEGNMHGTPSFWIGYEQVDKDALRERTARYLKASPEPVVVVRADRAANYRHVADLVTLLATLGVKRVSMAVFPLGSVFAIDPGPGRDGVIRGKVAAPQNSTKFDSYFVMLDHEAWTNQLGELPNMEVAARETFEFRNVPAGKCKVRARRVVPSGQGAEDAAMTEVDVIVKSKEVVEVELVPPASRAAHPADRDARQRFLAIERIARLSGDEQVRQLPRLYKQLAPHYMNQVIEGILSWRPENILDRTKSGGPGGDHRTTWTQQLADAASEMSPEQVADKLEIRLWLDIAARKRVIQVFKKHADATAALIDADLKSGGKQAVNRACDTILTLQLRSFVDRLLTIFMDDADPPEGVFRTLLFMRNISITRPLLERVEEDPKFIIRCAGLFQGPLWRKPAEPTLLKLLDSPDTEVRYHAVYALYECRDSKLAPYTVKLSGDKESRFRRAAAHVASNLPEGSFAAVRDKLLPLLNDEDETVRFDALRCFAEQKDLAAGPVILKVLRQDKLADGYRVTVMQGMSKMAGSTFGYSLHNWGPGTSGNKRAIEKFEAWLRTK